MIQTHRYLKVRLQKGKHPHLSINNRPLLLFKACVNPQRAISPEPPNKENSPERHSLSNPLKACKMHIYQLIEMIEIKCAICNEAFFRKENEDWKKRCCSCWFKGKATKRPPIYQSGFSESNLGYPVEKRKFYGKRSAFEIAKDNDLKRMEEQLEHFKARKVPFYLHVSGGNFNG